MSPRHAPTFPFFAFRFKGETPECAPDPVCDLCRRASGCISCTAGFLALVSVWRTKFGPHKRQADKRESRGVGMKTREWRDVERRD